MSDRCRLAIVAGAGLVLLSVVLGGCASAATYSAPRGQAVEVALGEASSRADVDLEDRQFKLTLEQIVDSRCPANAKCIWAGELAARISIQRVDKSPATREITLGESTVPSVEIMGAKLVLVSIDEKSVTFTVQASEGH